MREKLKITGKMRDCSQKGKVIFSRTTRKRPTSRFLTDKSMRKKRGISSFFYGLIGVKFTVFFSYFSPYSLAFYFLRIKLICNYLKSFTL